MPIPSSRLSARALLCGLALAAGAVSGAAAADAYPARPVRLIVPFAAGGTTDIVARAIAPRAGEALGQPLVVDNKGGGGGSIGAHEAARAQPDGYTLGVATVSTTATNPAINARLPYNPLTDFTPIINIAATPNVLAVHPGFKAQTFAAFVEEVKKNPHKHAYGTAGTGSIGHMLTELMASRAGLALTHVPYRGSSPALNDAVAGQIPIVFDNLPSALPFIKAGRLVALAVAAPERLPQLPQVPTFKELGLEEVNRSAFYGVVGPKGLPPEVVARVHAAVQRALSSPEVRRQIEDTGSRVIGNRPEEFAREIAAENAVYRKIATERRISAE
ncbi:MAG: tripartite tricarboxylate transporter substrate binding protein BugE [Burkholderiaceae bacterium]|nr:MAG: tripartite tricarboxylate transporter substrate binding protein BugE [Burkholderiaceae bacterium]